MVGGGSRHQLWIVAVEAHQRGLGELCCHALEGEADDDGRVETHSELQEQQPFVVGLLDKPAVAVGLLMPMLILHESVITSEVHGDRLAVGRMRYQFCGYAAVMDGWQSLFHPLPVGIQFLGRAVGGLEKGIVALCGKDALSVESRFFELTVHVGGDDEVILVLDERQQLSVERLRLRPIAGKPNVLGPICPALLLSLEGIE